MLHTYPPPGKRYRLLMSRVSVFACQRRIHGEHFACMQVHSMAPYLAWAGSLDLRPCLHQGSMRLWSPSAPQRRHNAIAAVVAWPSPRGLPGRSGTPLALPVTSKRMRRAAVKAGHRRLAATAAVDVAGADADAPAVISKITTVRRMTKVCTHQSERCHSIRSANETDRLTVSRRAVHKPVQLLATSPAPAQQPKHSFWLTQCRLWKLQPQLSKALVALGLDDSGTKPRMVERLWEAVTAGAEVRLLRIAHLRQCLEHTRDSRGIFDDFHLPRS